MVTKPTKLPDLRKDHPFTVWGSGPQYDYMSGEGFAFPRINARTARKIETALEQDVSHVLPKLTAVLYPQRTTQKISTKQQKIAIAALADYINPHASRDKFDKGIAALFDVAGSATTHPKVGHYAVQAITAAVVRRKNLDFAPWEQLEDLISHRTTPMPVKRAALATLPHYRDMAYNLYNNDHDAPKIAADHIGRITTKYLDVNNCMIKEQEEQQLLDSFKPSKEKRHFRADDSTQHQRFNHLAGLLCLDLLWSAKARGKALCLIVDSGLHDQHTTTQRLCMDTLLRPENKLTSAEAEPAIRGLTESTIDLHMLPRATGMLGRAFTVAQHFNDRKVTKAAQQLGLAVTDPHLCFDFVKHLPPQATEQLSTSFRSAASTTAVPSELRATCRTMAVFLDSASAITTGHAALGRSFGVK
jgi:hypothetical protein